MPNQKVDNQIRAMIIKSDSNSVQASNANDPEKQLWGGVAGIYEPPYSLSYLLKLPEYSNILQECLDAYANNIPGFGYEVVSVIDTNTQAKDDTKTAEAHKQKEEVEFLLKTCNYKDSFVTLMKTVVRNRESCGIGYLEVLLNRKGEVAGFEAVKNPSKFRILQPEGWVYKEMEVTLDSGKKTKTLPTRFYRFAYEEHGSITYFKEYGDTRVMDKKTGQYKSNRDVKLQDRATSLMVFRLPCAYSPYGLPRYIGKIPSIIGSRKSEELNISYFENGRMVPAAIIVENGKLTDESYKVIQESRGLGTAFRWLLLEATGAETNDSIIEGDNDKNKVNVDVKPLTEMMQQDGLFQDYDANNRAKIRSSFRVPPIYTGESSDYTKSTAQIARAVAEALVFQPEREELAEPLNRLIREAGYDLVEIRFKAPKLTDKAELSKSLAPYIQSGTATPNMLLESLGELLGKRFDPIQEDWGNKPIALVLKEIDKEMLIAQAEANNSNGEVSSNGNEPDDTSNDTKDDKVVKKFILDILKEYKVQMGTEV
jgi:PBSX family phage portal protein